MQVKTGIDIIEVNRIKTSIEDLGDKFINRIYTDKEIQYCNSKKRAMYQHYAARFAAKEAIFKAISTLMKDKYSISWKNVEVLNDENGKPEINFLSLDDKTEKEINKIKSIDMSISHIENYAIASATILID